MLQLVHYLACLKLLVVVVFLCLDYQHRDTVVIDVVDNAVIGCDVTRIGYIVSAEESLGMAQSSAWMLHDVQQNPRRFPEELWIGLLPLAHRLVSRLGKLYRVSHKLSK